jgi:hypothetical protein
MSESNIFQRQNSISRNQLLLYLSSALQERSIRFGRQTALSWLANYPGDMVVSLYLAKFLLMEGKNQQASTILEDICKRDPEYVDAQDSLATANAGSDSNIFENAISCAFALGKTVVDKDLVPSWGLKLRSAIKLYRTNQFEEAQKLIEEIMGYNLDVSLPAIYHLYIVTKTQDADSVNNLATLYQQRWPDTLVFNYMVIDGYFDRGDDANGVNLLHRCSTHDIVGQVAARVWGKDNPYQSIWPVVRSIPFNIPLPAEIAALYGWNKLHSGVLVSENLNGEKTVHETVKEEPEYFNSKTFDSHETAVEKETVETTPTNETVNTTEEVLSESKGTTSTDTERLESSTRVTKERVIKSDETVKSVEEAFTRLAKRMNQKNLEKADGRFPMYIILSTKKGLNLQYGPQTSAIIDKEMKLLAEAVKAQKTWGSLVYYPDDAENNPKLGLPVSKSIDPWEIKLALVDLDKSLSAKGSMVGAVLIVGGDEVVPFHRLPNPTDDGDSEVFSDNPYSTIDSNYFIPEWPVGRIPGEKGSDASLLLVKLREATALHNPGKNKKGLAEQLRPGLEIIRQLINFILLKPSYNGKKNFGYTAAVWQKSSSSVFKQIGESDQMLVSPPEYSGSFSGERINYSDLGYFNLHGLIDSGDWYGQPDASGSVSGVDYPIAIKPKDLHKNSKAPEVVFSEACYGGYVNKKSEADSLALTFLAIGTKAVVGSTSISYGSVATPLIGADLLGYLFWKYLKSGLRVGDSLVKAKIDFVREMNKRQNFLDGEDQKTLVSFVLYGDPLAIYSNVQAQNKNLARQKTKEDVKTACDKHNESEEADIKISPEKIRKVKEMVETYLPGIDQTKVVISKQLLVSEGNSVESAEQSQGSKEADTKNTGKTVITISKQVKSFNTVHQHYARATLDSSGKMIKLAVSR